MLNVTGLNFNSFYKFCTTLSLLVLIYCLSFDELFIRRYTMEMKEYSFEVVNLLSKNLYSEGISGSLTNSLSDTINLAKIQSIRFNPVDTSQKYIYYDSFKAGLRNKYLLDSLNLLNYDIINNKLKIKILKGIIDVEEKNIRTKRIIVIIIGFVAAICLIICLRKWYILKDKIDQ